MFDSCFLSLFCGPQIMRFFATFFATSDAAHQEATTRDRGGIRVAGPAVQGKLLSLKNNDLKIILKSCCCIYFPDCFVQRKSRARIVFRGSRSKRHETPQEAGPGRGPANQITFRTKHHEGQQENEAETSVG